jgi:3-oxoacyl-[acyl-carrier-protein] synthase II
MTPRPFDMNRDGVVTAEGCGVVVLESLDSALHRNAPIFAEIVGFSTVTDHSSIADPNADSIEVCIRKALVDGNVNPGDVHYVNAHATGTILGDIAEAEALARVFGKITPASSLKGHLGHTMAASGALEIIATIGMMHRRTLIPTRNLDNIDPLCKGPRLIQDFEQTTIEVVIKNNFALGGVNSCVVLRRYENDR